MLNCAIDRSGRLGNTLPSDPGLIIRKALGGPLLLDIEGAPGSYEGTYIGMMDYNLTTIARALGGSPPDGGMQGHLRRRGNLGRALTRPSGPQATPVF